MLPGTCLYCCRGCTPPPPSGLGTECTRCCAGLCCLWPEGKQSREDGSTQGSQRRGRKSKYVCRVFNHINIHKNSSKNTGIFIEKFRHHLHPPVCHSEPPKGCFFIHVCADTWMNQIIRSVMDNKAYERHHHHHIYSSANICVRFCL